MIIVDTSIWIDFLKGNPEIQVVLMRFIEQKYVIGLSFVFAELWYGAKSKKEYKIISQYYEVVSHIDESDVWIHAGELSFEKQLRNKGVGLLDSGILACAQEHNAKIWTLDKKLIRVLPNDLRYE